MSQYRKLIAAIVGLVAVILGPSVLGLAPGEEIFGLGQERVVEMIIGLVTAISVYAVRNEEKA